MSGRDLFTYNPDLVGQDEEDMEGGVAFERDANDEDEDSEAEVKAFVIDERTFYCIDDEGHMLDDDLDEDDKVADAVTENVEINEELFDVDDVPDLENLNEKDEDAVAKMARLKLEEKNSVK
ncbi:unnamed protein product [Gongylonema pulchrum]|uniref:TBP-binding domain-containing protein n=1 Tax=Gongylonema pulchrum TaxID=637853 RepID=A0A183E6G1_9BILA|nr:unnamed protein product [Gongylonema pulchrum]